MSKFVANCVVMGVKARPSQDGKRIFRNAVLYFEEDTTTLEASVSDEHEALYKLMDANKMKLAHVTINLQSTRVNAFLGCDRVSTDHRGGVGVSSRQGAREGVRGSSDGLDCLNCLGATHVGDVFRLYIPGWLVCRAALSLSAYLGFIVVLGIMLCVTPAQALVSTTGHARIASQSAMNALNVAKRSLAVQSIGSAIASSGSGASVAARIVASGVGWPAIGIAAGLVVAQYFWNQQQVADIKSQAGDPGPVSAGANPMPAGTIIQPCPGTAGCIANSDQKLTAPSPQPPPSPGLFGANLYVVTLACWLGRVVFATRLTQYLCGLSCHRATESRVTSPGQSSDAARCLGLSRRAARQ